MCTCCKTNTQCCGASPHRRYLTRDEEIEHLQTYKQQLEHEIRGINEYLKKFSP